MKLVPRFISLACLLFCLGVRSSSAALLYDLDFTPSEVGTYTVVFGSPTVSSSFGGLSTALVFHAVTSYDQIRLNLGAGSPGYQINFDVVTHGLRNSQYAFSMDLDTPQIRTLEFHGGLNSVYVFQPYSGSGILQPLADDSIEHVATTVDILHNLWTISVNGVGL